MEASIARLEMLYHSGVHVKRCHTIPTVAPRTTAEHVYGAMCVARELCHLSGMESGRVLAALLTHDSPEVHTGDVPANVKKQNPEFARILSDMEEEFHLHFNTGITLTEEEEAVVNAADNLDFMFACLNERRMGNRHPYLTTVYRRSSSYLMEKHLGLPGVAPLAAYIDKEWDHV